MRANRSSFFASFFFEAMAIALSLTAFMGLAQAQDIQPSVQPRIQPVSQPGVLSGTALIEQGRKLAIAADCAACHTAPKGVAPFAGGYAIASPLGAIYASNITPSQANGIGGYTLADFRRALREGIRKDGAHLYPAMPYTSYTQLSDADTEALYAYFMHGVMPVEKRAPETALPFPFNLRVSMVAWNRLFLKDVRFVPDASKTVEVNRGAYLAGALAHCSACHTARNALMAEEGGQGFLSGGSLGAWYAPNITADANHGIGAWSGAELVQYLKTGRVPGKAQAAGPMAEAIENSLQYLPEEDLKAIAAYLKQTPAVGGSEAKPRFAYGEPSNSETELRGMATGVDSGWRIFSGNCAACHQANANGTSNNNYPSLFHNTTTGADRPDNLIATLLFGVDRTVEGQAHFMPAFGDAASFASRLDDQEIADVSNYVFSHYGNPDVKVSAHDVQVIRAGGKPPFIAQMRPMILPGVFVVLVVLIVILARRSRAQHRRNSRAL